MELREWLIETGKRCADHLVGSVSHNIAVSVQGNHELGQQQHLWLCAHSEGLGGQNLVCRVLLATHTHTTQTRTRTHLCSSKYSFHYYFFVCYFSVISYFESVWSRTFYFYEISTASSWNAFGAKTYMCFAHKALDRTAPGPGHPLVLFSGI